jgi:mono/diheme cytochrome c family protein
MKINFSLKKAFTQTLMVLFTFWSGLTYAQTKPAKMYLIPDSINAVFENSCMSCHGINGGRFPKARLNFARWEEYGAQKQVEKASMICSVLTKGIMPPKSFRKTNPEAIPTSAQVEMICQWARSIKSVNAEKKSP